MRIRATLIALLLIASLSTAQVPGPMIPLTNTRYRGPGVPSIASLATNGQTTIAAWRTPTDIRVSRIDGRSAGVPVLRDSSSASVGRPALTAVGMSYLVATSVYGEIHLAFLDSEGRLTGTPPALLTDSHDLVAASTRDTISLLYSRVLFGHPGLEASILDSGGRVTRAGISLDSRQLNRSLLRFAIVTNGRSYLVTESYFDAIKVFAVDKNGTVAPPFVLEGPSTDAYGRHVAAASNGNAYFVVWSSSGTLRGQPFDSGGNAAGYPTLVAEGPSTVPGPYAPRVAWDGSQYVCIYLLGYDGASGTSGSIRIARIDPDSRRVATEVTDTVLSTFPDIVSGSRGTVAAWSARETYLTWESGERGPDLNGGAGVGAFVTGALMSQPFPISIGANDQVNPVGISNGTETLVAWVERSADGAALRTGIVTATGSWKEGAEFSLSSFATIKPVVATDGRNFLVAWGNSAVRIDPNGMPIDLVPLTLDQNLSVTSASYDNSNYALVGNYSGPGRGIAGTLVSPTGSIGRLVLIRPQTSSDYPLDPQIASSGSGFLMTFSRIENCPFPCIAGQSGSAMLLQSDLTRAGKNEIVLYDDAVIGTAVAWNGLEYLAVVRNYGEVLGRRISREGVNLDSTAIPIAAPTPLSRISKLSLIATGPRFFIAWRNETGPVEMTLAAIENDGTVSSFAKFNTGIDSSSDPKLIARTSNDVNIFASANLVETPYYGAERIVRQTLFTAAPKPPAPRLTAGVLDGGSTTLQWTGVADAIGYRAEDQDGNDGWLEAEGFLGSDRTSATLRGLREGANYQFRIRAWGLNGVSSYSNEVSPTRLRRRA